MKKILIPVVVLLALVSCNKEMAPAGEQEELAKTEVREQACVPGISIVKLTEEMTGQIESELETAPVPTKSSSWNSIVTSLGITSFRRLFPYDEQYEARQREAGLHTWYVIEYDKKQPVTKANEDLSMIPGVEIAEPRRRAEITRKFNDPKWDSQWALENDGDFDSKVGCDVHVRDVWEKFTTGSPKVTVAVIDGGIQLDHPDLADNVIAPGENGSKNFCNTPNYDIQPEEHGTHVAGIISAVNNNGIGISSIAGGDKAAGQKGVRLMSCQIFQTEADGTMTSGDFPAAIVWAANKGANIAQNSWGYPVDQDGDGVNSEKEINKYLSMGIAEADKVAINYFIKNAGCDENGEQLPDSPMKGGLVVFAAGNDNVGNGIPASYSPIIAVGSMDRYGKKSWFSNFGNWVDIAAPGSEIYSTITKGRYDFMDGTSMACPQVSAVAALILSYHGGKGYTNADLEKALIQGANANMLAANQHIGPMVDALGSMAYGTNELPVQAHPSYKIISNTVECSWQHTASKNNIAANGYMLLATQKKGVLEKITDLKQLPAGVRSKAFNAPLGSKIGDKMSTSLEGLEFDKDYYVALVAYGYGLIFEGKYEISSVHTEKNNAPVISLPVGNDVKIKTFETFTSDIKVTDPDGHKVIVSYDPFRDGKLSLTPVMGEKDLYRLNIEGPSFEPGHYVLKIHATDEYDAVTTVEFSFEITENHPPVILQQIGNIICNQIDQKYRLPLSEYITDPDHEKLQIAVKVSNKNVLKAAYEEDSDELFIQALKYGNSDISVVATDAVGKSVEMKFTILVRRKEEVTNLYPNPMREFLNIRTGETLEAAHVEIYSSTGSVVFKGDSECSAFQPMKIDVSYLAPGSYKVKVNYGGITDSKTVIKI